MAKVNEFETAQYNYQSGSKQRFSDEANEHYTYTSADDLVGKPDDLSEIIQNHMQHQRPRLKMLQDYYKGNNTSILRSNRRKEEHLADHRAPHNFAKYVSQFIQGYMVGIPLKTTYPEEAINEQLRDINRENDADEHNSDLVLDQSIYGRAYEMLYRNHADETKFILLDVLGTFVIYDDTVEMKPIAGVRYTGGRFQDDETTVYLYTKNKRITYSMDNAYQLAMVEEEPHYFQGVPIIEYENNRFREGDYEDVLNLIDLYDASQSDTANYMTDLNDAMLKILGSLDLSVEEARTMKDSNIIMLQSEQSTEGRFSNVDAEYIYKQYDVQGMEAYKDRIANDIHLFTATPNMSDSNFAGTQSGESLKYKLFSLEQKRATKERLFKKSLRDRYRLINNIISVASEGGFDVNDIDITFTENLPVDVSKEMEWFAKLGGRLSQKTMLAQLSFVENPDEEMEQIEQEREERDTFMDNYGFAETSEEIDDGQEE